MFLFVVLNWDCTTSSVMDVSPNCVCLRITPMNAFRVFNINSREKFFLPFQLSIDNDCLHTKEAYKSRNKNNF